MWAQVEKGTTKGVSRFVPYLAYLEDIVQARVDRRDPRLIAALNGEPSERVQALVRQTTLQRKGIYFTGRDLADQLLLRVDFKEPDILADPACGSGDLLLAAARKLPLARDYERTLESWGRKLAGNDIHLEFVRATKLRLCLLAIERGMTAPTEAPDLERLFPNITKGNAIEYSPTYVPTIVVMNPPYIKVPAPQNCTWAEGSVCAAAVFIDQWLELLPHRGKLLAILPDVLRTGSNYRAWREAVLRRARVEDLKVLGRFGPSADVDVFSSLFVVGSTNRTGARRAWKWPLSCRGTVGDKFTVRVGCVVPHRDKKSGKLHAYLHAKNTLVWGTIERIKEKVLTEHPVFAPPFVAIRRTSSPSDNERAVGTLVLGRRQVAIENHLIVLRPKRGGAALCRKLMEVLKADITTCWLNQRIRCRHLTVGVVREIPWMVLPK